MRIVFPAFFLLFSTAAAAAPDVRGNWITQDGNGLIAIGPCGDKLCGSIARVLVSRPGVPKTDVKNSDPALRSRPLQGLRILSGFSQGPSGWENGQIYDPKSGKSYRSTMKLNADGSLKVSGCIAVFCKSQRWTRAK